jgi:Protein of unknown function (DUF2778)
VIHIGLRSTYAWIGALVFGFALGLVVTYVLADAGRRPADVETTPPKDIDFQRPLRSQIPNNSGMRLASLEMPARFGDAVEENDLPAFSRSRASSGDRLLVDDRLAFFNERFVGAASSGNASTGATEYGDSPFPYSLDLAEKAAQPTTGRSAPKPAPSSPLASAAKKRLHVADLSPDVNSLQADSHTAIYDIAARTVYLPNGRRLEAHSGLGDLMDDPRYINVKARGPTPPNVYNLTLREELFHGVRAIRLNPVDDGKMFGREGMLAHTYMLGPNGQSNGCVSFSDYPAFLNAYLKGEVDRLVVVDHLTNPPASETASGWIPEVIKDFFRRS